MIKNLVLTTLCMAAYAALLVFSLWYLNHHEITGAGRIAITLLPVLPALVLCWVVLRVLRRLDEMQRKLQFEALAFAFAGTAILSLGYGFLENIGFPPLSMFVVWPVMAALWLVAGLDVLKLQKVGDDNGRSKSKRI